MIRRQFGALLGAFAALGGALRGGHRNKKPLPDNMALPHDERWREPKHSHTYRHRDTKSVITAAKRKRKRKIQKESRRRNRR